MKKVRRYARIEFVQAVQWLEEEPLDDMIHFSDEAVETALETSTRPVYVVNAGSNDEPQQIKWSDWIVYSNDGTKEVLPDPVFKSIFVNANQAKDMLDELNA